MSTGNRIVRWAEAVPVEMISGLVRRTLAETAGAMMVEFRAETGVQIPVHCHPYQQVGYVVSGRVALTIDGVRTVCDPSDSYAIPGDVAHDAMFLAPSIVVDCFSPPRKDYR